MGSQNLTENDRKITQNSFDYKMKVIKIIKEHYIIYRQQRNGHLEELKMITGSLGGI